MFGSMGEAQRIARCAMRQHGVFSASQARASGFDKHAVARRLASKAWIQLDYRVFGLPSAAATWERQMWIALLSRPAAVVGGRAAAHMHGFKGFKRTKPVIVVPGSANARSQIAQVVRSEHFDELEVERVRGMPVTSIAETLLLLAGELSNSRLEEVLDDLILSGRVEAGDLMPVLDRERGRRRRGSVFYRGLVEDRLADAPHHDSNYLERVLARLLGEVSLPQWSLEHPFTLGDRASRVDVFIHEWRLVIEADGRNIHARRIAFETDRRRDNELAMQGIQVIRLTHKMLTEDPLQCLNTILAVGRVRSA